MILNEPRVKTNQKNNKTNILCVYMYVNYFCICVYICVYMYTQARKHTHTHTYYYYYFAEEEFESIIKLLYNFDYIIYS